MKVENAHIQLSGQFLYGKGVPVVLFNPTVDDIDFSCLLKPGNALEEFFAAAAANQADAVRTWPDWGLSMAEIEYWPGT